MEYLAKQQMVPVFSRVEDRLRTENGQALLDQLVERINGYELFPHYGPNELEMAWEAWNIGVLLEKEILKQENEWEFCPLCGSPLGLNLQRARVGWIKPSLYCLHSGFRTRQNSFFSEISPAKWSKSVQTMANRLILQCLFKVFLIEKKVSKLLPEPRNIIDYNTQKMLTKLGIRYVEMLDLAMKGPLLHRVSEEHADIARGTVRLQDLNEDHPVLKRAKRHKCPRLLCHSQIKHHEELPLNVNFDGSRITIKSSYEEECARHHRRQIVGFEKTITFEASQTVKCNCSQQMQLDSQSNQLYFDDYRLQTQYRCTNCDKQANYTFFGLLETVCPCIFGNHIHWETQRRLSFQGVKQRSGGSGSFSDSAGNLINPFGGTVSAVKFQDGDIWFVNERPNFLVLV